MTHLSIARRASFLTAVLLWAFAQPLAHGQGAARYEAALFDGTRLRGDNVFGWHEHPASPRLDNTALLDAKRPLRWLRDDKLKPWRPGEYCPGYIEFVGGDRLVGRLVGVRQGSEVDGVHVPAHLLIKPVAPLHRPIHGSPPYVRILPGRIQRVVFQSPSHRRLEGGTLFCRDGRRLAFLSLRWQEESVALLLKDSTSEVKLSEIAEIHLPPIDPWQAYYEELAVLSPGCRSRLMRVETAWGLVATGSDLLFRAVPFATPGHTRQAMAHLKRLDEQISRMENDLKGPRKKLDDARAESARESATIKAQLEAARKAFAKAKGEMQRRFDQGKKDGAAREASEREKIEREFRSADEAMVKQTAGEKPPKRDELLKAFRRKQAQLRKAREDSLRAVRVKADQRRRKEFDQVTKQETDKLKRLEAGLQNRINQLKTKLDQAAAEWAKRSRAVEQAKSRRAASRGAVGTSNTWYHMLQPVWSLDPLWMPFHAIYMRWSFAPEQVLLCRLRPAATVTPPLLPVYTNRNSVGHLLRSGGRQYAWGFAVHAYSELRFALPKSAKTFRSDIGLDRMVGPGGCARARVYVGSTRGRPAYEGPLLVGSKRSVDTGRVNLQSPAEGPRHLILQADPAHRDSPTGADPLNIRDKLNWLDPWIELDTSGLQDQVRRKVGPLLASSQGWTLGLERRGVYTWTSHFDETGSPGAGRFWTMLRAQGQPLTVSREMTIGLTDKWLAVRLGLPTGENPPPDAVTLRVGRRQIQPRKVPIRQRWQSRPVPLVFSLDQYRGKEITLELTHPPGGEPLLWRAVSTLATPPPAYRLVDIMKIAGRGDMHVSYELGQALQSNQLGAQEKLAALEISQFGGIVNFRPSVTTEVPSNRLANVLIGSDWAGGDKTFIKTFATFRRMPSLEMLLVTKDSGVSDGAIAKLQAELPKLTITRFIKRVPSLEKGPSSPVTWRNLSGKDVVILWIDAEGDLQFSVTRDLKPGQELRRHAFAGVRYEAHYFRKDYAHAKDYTFSQPLTSFVVAPGAVWEIRPGQR